MHRYRKFHWWGPGPENCFLLSSTYFTVGVQLLLQRGSEPVFLRNLWPLKISRGVQLLLKDGGGGGEGQTGIPIETFCHLCFPGRGVQALALWLRACSLWYH